MTFSIQVDQPASPDPKSVLNSYIEQAMSQCVIKPLEDGSFAGRIPACVGVIAFGDTAGDCRQELRSTLEGWILLGLKLKHPLPVIGNIDLGKELGCDPMDVLQKAGFDL